MTVGYTAEAYTYVTDPAQVEEAVRRLLDSAREVAAERGFARLALGFDTETYGTCEHEKGSPYKPGLDPYTTRIRLMQFSTGKHHLILDVKHLPYDYLGPVFDLLTDPQIIKVVHNAKFDFKQVKQMFDLEISNLFCTMLGSQILAAGMPCSHRLKDVAVRYLGVALDKAEQTSDWSADPLTAEQLDYASADTQILVDLYQEQRKQLSIYRLLPVAKLEFDCAKAAAWLELNGVFLSRDMWTAIYEDRQRKREQIREELTEALDQGGWLPDVNLNSGAQIIEGLKHFGINLPSAAMKELKVHADVPIVAELIAYKEALSAHKKRLKDGLSEDSMDAHDFARALSRMADQLAEKIAEKLPRERVSLDSPTQVLKALQGFGERHHLHELINLKGTNEKDHLKPLTSVPVVAMLLDYREVQKATDMYGESFLRHIHPATGRIHPEFNTLRADTGRMSASNPNLQNIPHADEYRACFVCPPGRKLITLDYSQIEPRILAEIANDPAFDAVFTSGEDLYVSAAKMMFEDDTVTKQDPRRKVSKALMLGLFYGKGAAALGEEIAATTGQPCSKEQAQAYIDKFAARFPLVWKNLNDAAKRAVIERQSMTMMGRIRRFRLDGVTDKHVKEFYGPHKNRLYDDEEYAEAFRKIGSVQRQGKNTPIQGTSADITKLGAVYLFNEYKWTDVKLVNIVHDEFVIEVNEAEADAVAKRAEQLMIDAAKVYVKRIPIKVGVGIDTRWAKD